MSPMFFRAAIVVGLDQLSKAVIRRLLAPGQSLPVWPQIFHLSYVQNSGAAFGLLRGQTWILITFAVVVVGAITFYAGHLQPHGLLGWALSLVLGGAVGNLIDRLRLGYVVDFFDFRIWPVFNVADIAIVVGVGIIIIYFWRSGGDPF